MGQDLQVIGIGRADLEAPGGHVVVALDEHPDFTFARFEAGVELARGNFEGGGHFLGHVLVIEAKPIAAFTLGHAMGLQVFGGPAGNHLAGLAHDLQGFTHLLHPHPVAGEAITARLPGHGPVEVVVALVVINFA